MNAAERARRLFGWRAHRRARQWGPSHVTAQLLAYVLGVREQPVSDRDYQTVARTARSDYGTEAQQVPLALARVLALQKEGRERDAARLLGTLTEPEPEPVEATAEPAPPQEQDAGPAGELEVVPTPEADEVNGPEASLPDHFPERDRLLEAGFGTLQAVNRASDAELQAVNGIGPAKVSLIRAAVTVEGV